ncbi:hypothetical protein HBI56_182940 [Parastagonospora nodorum]|uniref:Uncharacterized protein n=1 Tax=Phaeosphaeria nodorum (strain SN15 / ATCC MYA-4574 / FGSC 10173) TaxID=321614 RepID=A0A7U2FF55_PHANO|nr:hypothetical protein HBH56_191420 [Parastagonospora nodorum]QRD03114.1 hypothetical protein JI435_419180 [Parastagonospora nodorum SN15]KAH3938151.1 hypothetical protein HBH54_010580 [Parastagonospora nodorum]KAH3940755.1 hypothetical protein HBH53_211760 [Parastagonospora nodorum]KAH3966421.1 hypothetical protein HBH52_199600 [Parastagonospora nodorum]
MAHAANQPLSPPPGNIVRASHVTNSQLGIYIPPRHIGSRLIRLLSAFASANKSLSLRIHCFSADQVIRTYTFILILFSIPA